MLKYGYTIADTQNHATRTSSNRCWVSRRYTLIADNAIANADANNTNTTNATGNAGKYSNDGVRMKINNATNNTKLCKKKSRSPPRSTPTPTPHEGTTPSSPTGRSPRSPSSRSTTPPRKSSTPTNPTRKKIAKYGTFTCNTIWNTTENTTKYNTGFNNDHTNPNTLFL